MPLSRILATVLSLVAIDTTAHADDVVAGVSHPRVSLQPSKMFVASTLAEQQVMPIASPRGPDSDPRGQPSRDQSRRSR